MKANELMIGDWVLYATRPIKINGISVGGGSVHSDSENWVSVADLAPIPLTPEILEKNGFSVGIYNILKIDENRRLEYYHYKNRLTLYYKGVDEWDNHTEQEETIFICQCVYVHELQNALRLCGIDKKITL